MCFRKPDPRAGLFILLLANIGMFLERTGRQGNVLAGVIIVVLILFADLCASCIAYSFYCSVFRICEYDKTDVVLSFDRGIVS